MDFYENLLRGLPWQEQGCDRLKPAPEKNKVFAMKKSRKERFEHNLQLLIDKGYKPVQQTNCWFHYKDMGWNFYPTTGKCFNDYTKERCTIEDLPILTEREDFSKKHAKKHKILPNGKKPPKAYRYFNLDRRYLPDWVLAQNRQEWLKGIFK